MCIIYCGQARLNKLLNELWKLSMGVYQTFQNHKPYICFLNIGAVLCVLYPPQNIFLFAKHLLKQFTYIMSTKVGMEYPIYSHGYFIISMFPKYPLASMQSIMQYTVRVRRAAILCWKK